MNVPSEVVEGALHRYLLSFSQEFIKQTKDVTFNYKNIQCFHLISFLTNLTELNLFANQISEISTISKLINLKKLNLRRNRVEDISALQYLPDLTHLDLQQNILTSYTFVLPNLVELSLRSNILKDKSGIEHSPKLQDLNLSETKIVDLRTIPHSLYNLKALELYRNNITEISYISNFVSLQSVNLRNNQQLQNIEPLKDCIQLIQLNITDSSVADIWSLQFMANLKSLDMCNTQVIDLHPLQHLYKLESIYAFRAQIIDVSPLSNLPKLKSLLFSGNKIINGETLKHHTNFIKFDLSDQKLPTPDELKFYNKILSVHSSHEQIRKIMIRKIQAVNRASKFRESLTHQKEYFNKQIQYMNMKIELWVEFIQNSSADQ
ncbi:leucine-rich_repeat-containing protein [Hexamita inflata]|uniref:Leucine-rich repeat-containing protein n=1 Tax=Hexamita inflata TaxID=28002 RepID=A0AA86U2H9_9EUKA|nr:leucine-rich repeat-containing protein [Hexamita inflata]CAI9933870.1 leucine-rich repeat-containing protein [Hexamita inflata]